MIGSPNALFRLAAPALVALAVGSGCSGTVTSSSNTNTSSTMALLSVERSAPASDVVSAPRSHASAYFLRLQAGADDVLAARLVGASLTLPAVDRCESIDALWNQGLPLASLAPVELVDVGEVSLEAEETSETMAARAFPDVIDLVSGVVYTTRDQIAASLPDEGRYVFRISGSAAFPRVTLGANAPGPPDEVTIGETPLGSAPIVLERRDVALRWRAGGGASVIYVDLVSNEDGAVDRVRCTFADVGRAILPSTALPRSATQIIAIHRVLRETPETRGWDGEQLQGEAGSRGLDAGEIRFDLAVTGGLRFETAAP